MLSNMLNSCLSDVTAFLKNRTFAPEKSNQLFYLNFYNQ